MREDPEMVEHRSPDRMKKKDGVRSFPRVGVTPRDTLTSGGYRTPFSLVYVWTRLKNKKTYAIFPGCPYNGPPICVSPPRHFQTYANGHLIPHPLSRIFLQILTYSCNISGLDPRAESGKTAAAQNNLKAQFSIHDGLY